MAEASPSQSELENALARIDAYEPRIHALMAEPGRRARLEAEAARLAERPGTEQGPLFGALVVVKDVFHVDGLPTTGGSRLPPEELAGPEATCVSRLRQAGALVIGKAVSTEFAFYAPGPTRNPRDPVHTPGGSSSGSAAAVAAGYCPLALGTQTIGSVTRPASFCGVVGYKPSYGRIPSDGLIPLAPSFDHVGVLAASVEWVHRAAAVLCDGWRADAWQGTVDSLRRPVLGVPEGAYLDRADSTMRRHFEAVVERLAAVGWEVRRVTAFEQGAEAIDGIEAAHRTILAAEVAAVHERWVARYGELYHPTTLALIEEGRGVDADTLAAARRSPARLRSRLGDRMAGEGVDLWISPSAPGPAPEGIDSTGDPVMNRPWSHAGLPTLGLPSGDDPASGLPLGIQLAAGFGKDEELLAWGAELSTELDRSSETRDDVMEKEGMQ